MFGATFLAWSFLATGNSTAIPLVVDPHRPSTSISSHLFGVFFEEINHAGDGGLYPELVSNPAFHAFGKTVGDWVPSSGTHWLIDSDRAIAQLPPNGKLSNPGYWGISVLKGQKYTLTVQGHPGLGLASDSRSESTLIAEFFEGQKLKFAKVLKVKLGSRPQKSNWVNKSLQFMAPASLRKGMLVLKAGDQGVALRYVSILPLKTFKQSGLRFDLASAVAEIKPAFVRFPGGCYVEGGDYLKDRFQWKTTVQPNSDRPGHLNATWGYWSTDGLGFHEYLQWCEDMRSEPLFVINCGLSHKEQASMQSLSSYLQDALDALEYANGPASSKWGSLRARRGHPKPFNLKYIEIGNENGMFGNSFGGTKVQYTERYLPIYKAIKAKYPQVRTVADTRISAPVEIVDDHYYNSPAWFWQNVGIYDNAPRNGPKIYVGEYAVTQDCGNGNLRAALAEAAFMTGLERNGDIVEMASYAPLFVRKENRAWNPDAIVFDDTSWYGTPSYWVQQLFAKNRVDKVIAVSTPKVEVPPSPGGIGLGSWHTSVEYRDVKVTLPDGSVLNENKFEPKSGNWTFDGISAKETAQVDPAVALGLDPSVAGALNYTLTLRARKLDGNEGFLILARAKDNQNFIWWNIGGWGNTSVAVEKENNGGRGVISPQVPFHVETDRWYDIKVVAQGEKLSLFIDGQLIQTAEDRGTSLLATDAGIDSTRHELVLKVVNGSSKEQNLDVVLPGVRSNAPVEVQTLRASDEMVEDGKLMDLENSFEKPNAISIYKSKGKLNRGHLELAVKRGSVSVVRVQLS